MTVTPPHWCMLGSQHKHSHMLLCGRQAALTWAKSGRLKTEECCESGVTRFCLQTSSGLLNTSLNVCSAERRMISYRSLSHFIDLQQTDGGSISEENVELLLSSVFSSSSWLSSNTLTSWSFVSEDFSSWWRVFSVSASTVLIYRTVDVTWTDSIISCFKGAFLTTCSHSEQIHELTYTLLSFVDCSH